MPASAAASLKFAPATQRAKDSSLVRDVPLLGVSETLGNSTLHVARQDITFHSPTRECVAVAITVTNVGGGRSLPTAALVGAAPFGAFVPWQPLAVVPVPALLSGQATELRFDAGRPQVQPLGPPDRVPPRRLLVALGAGDDRAGRRSRT